MSEEKFTLEMPKVGLIKGVLAKDIEVVGEKVVNLRTCARPYRNYYSANQLRTLAEVARKYGSGKVHLSPRHNFEIPEVRLKELEKALKELYIAGLFPAGAGTSVRNIFTCPSWCTASIRPVQELGLMVSKNFGDMDMPNKVTISFAGCANGCSRPQNTDIGIVAMAEVLVTGANCPEGCSECIDVCVFDAIEIKNNRPTILKNKCTGCVRCIKVCRHGVLKQGQTGFRVLIGGKEGTDVRFGHELARGLEDFEVLELVDSVLRWYQHNATYRPGSQKKLERLAEVIDRVGLLEFPVS